MRPDRREYYKQYRELHQEERRVSAAANYASNKFFRQASSKDYRKRLKQARPWFHMLRCARSRAKLRGLDYGLTPQWAAARWTGRCELTGLPFIIDTSGTPGPKPYSATVDRINQRKGYEPGNCRFVLSCVNNFRGTLGDDEMWLVAAALITKHDSDR